jgi:hypothetical protein
MASWQFMVTPAESIHGGLVIDDSTGQLKKWWCSNLRMRQPSEKVLGGN